MDQLSNFISEYRGCNRNCVSSDDLHSKFCQIPELSVKAGTLILTDNPVFKTG